MMWLALMPLLIWTYMLLGRGMFWLMRERDDRKELHPPQTWPSVVAIVPARDEADVIADTLGSLLKQDYPGVFRIVVVDDQSADGTVQAASAKVGQSLRKSHVEILSGRPRPQGWTGKLWAMCQGVEHALANEAPDFFLFTDADIAHEPDNVRRLAERAANGRFVLVSLMAKLACKSFAERLLIPAFVFFFDMLFPFAWVNNSCRRTAAAAGGCMLVRRDALLAAGGLEPIRGEIIDDCALARVMKRKGPIWLGLTERAQSMRPYASMSEIRRMIARSAYAQLGYSPWLLAGTVLGMLVVYGAAPLITVFGHGQVRLEAAVAWTMMTLAFQPILRFYRLSPLWAAALPLTGALYTAFTIDSALQFWRGKGGMWKGRAQATV